MCKACRRGCGATWRNAKHLAGLVKAAPDWRVVAPVPLQTVCVRHEPAGLSGAALDAHTKAWAEAVNRSGAAYLTPATIDGRWMVRVSVGSLTTETADIEAVWRDMQAAALEGMSGGGSMGGLLVEGGGVLV